MTDSAYLLEVLSDGEPHSTSAILKRSIDERGHGLMVHSRAADLRAKGHLITCLRVPGKSRGEAWVYTLLGSLPEPTRETEAPPPVGSGSDPLDRKRGDRSALPQSGSRVAATPAAQTGGVPAPRLFELDERPVWA